MFNGQLKSLKIYTFAAVIKQKLSHFTQKRCNDDVVM